MSTHPDLVAQPHAHPSPPHSAGSCCCGTSGSAVTVTVMGGPVPSALRVSGGHLVPGPVQSATPLFMGVAGDDGTAGVVLGVAPGQLVRVTDGVVSVGAGAGAAWVFEPHPALEGGYRARLDGSYLVSDTDGAPLRLVCDSALASVLVLTPVRAALQEQVTQPGPAAERDPEAEEDESVVPRLGWAAEEDSWNSPTGSTHYWIFLRAAELIRDMAPPPASLAGAHVELKSLLGTPRFHDAVAHGIDDADNKGALDCETSGLYYSAHFYDHELNAGGFWGPDPRTINAYRYGRKYFEDACRAGDAQSAGRALGLSIHYLTDVCQPMHAALVPNNPLPWLSKDGKLGWQHSNYEFWALSVQADCGLALRDLDLSGYGLGSDWWMLAAKAGLAEAKVWFPSSSGPILGGTPDKLSMAEAKRRGRVEWLPRTRTMLQLSQTLTVGMLLAWAARAKITEAARVAPGTRQLKDLKHGRMLVAGQTYDGRIYHSTYDFAHTQQRWFLEPVTGPDGAQLVSDDGPVFALRDARHGKYLIAGDRADNNVYHGDLAGRANGRWALQPVTGRDGKVIEKQIDGQIVRGVHLVDQKHRLCLVAGDTYDGHVYHQAHGGRANAVWFVTGES